MEDDNNNNKIAEEFSDPEEFKFKYNFINTPWDDRCLWSKIGIVTLLLVIFFTTLICIVINFMIHYKGFYNDKIAAQATNKIKCHMVKMDDYRFAARIHLVSSQDLLCVGAVVSKFSVVASGICVKSGPIFIQLGSVSEPRCKKGFSVDIIEHIFHDGTISKSLVLLTTSENMEKCASVITIGNKIDLKSQAYIIGRPLRVEKSFSCTPATLAESDQTYVIASVKKLNQKNMICVKDLAMCPVRAGDLLIQNDNLYGLASTSVHRTDQSKMACFADFKLVRQQLKEIDVEIETVE